MKTKSLLIVLSSFIAASLLVVACNKENEKDAPETPASYSFIPVDQWLPGTQWVVQRRYQGSLGLNWSQFIQDYSPSFLGGPVNANCMDTAAFDDHTCTFYGVKNNWSSEYSVADSLVTIDNVILYQINSDSMIVYDWHDCSFTQDVQIWLFTKIR